MSRVRGCSIINRVLSCHYCPASECGINSSRNPDAVPAKLVPAKTGSGELYIKELDSRFHGNDGIAVS
jgi:hypothetical protein